MFRLDAILGRRLIPVFYALGLCGIGLWAVDHLFASFAYNFGQGLWGILEILVYGPLWILLLRLVCEALQVFFKANESAANAVNRGKMSRSLLEEVGDAIHELADDDDDFISPATDPAPFVPDPTDIDDIDPASPLRGPVVKRTAKRTPPKPSDAS